MRRNLTATGTTLAFCLLLLSPALAADSPVFRVTFTEDVRAEPFSGRVYVFLSQRMPQPRLGPSWFNPEVFLARDVVDWRPGEPIELSAAGQASENTLVYPRTAAEIDLSGYQAQAVARFNPLDREVGRGAGNGYSPVIEIKDQEGPIALTINQLVEPQEFHDTKWSKLLRVRSERLSKFHGRDVYLQAAVILPASYYEQPERRYPTIFTIPGFGGTHHMGRTDEPVEEDHPKNPGGVEFLRVWLDPSCPLGHHVFADSANNGPVGTALVEEFIPAFDRRFRSIADPSARFLTGHSSGGWSSLWLQVTYPETFGGVWSTAPDPVDFRDFQQINLYQPGENMYVDADGRRRPLARRGDEPVLWYRDFAEMEWVLGPGGQLHSFEAVFSPRDPETGQPKLLWDRQTGAINTDVARTWQKYDIRRVLERNWKTLAPKLRGKLHVFMGDRDTFYLEGATRLLKESLEKLGSDAVVEIHEGRDHSSLMTPELRQRIRREMAETFLERFPEP